MDEVGISTTRGRGWGPDVKEKWSYAMELMGKQRLFIREIIKWNHSILSYRILTSLLKIDTSVIPGFPLNANHH